VRRALTAALLGALLGCGAAPEDPPDEQRLRYDDDASASPPVEEFTVELELDARREGESVLVQGSTDLPDGTLISIELRHERFGSLPWGTGFEDGAARVRNGRFAERIAIPGWPAGRIDVWVAFQPTSIHGEQPEPVLERYGRSGERLAGDNVVREGAARIVETVQSIR
jgi:hypothetical protein